MPQPNSNPRPVALITGPTAGIGAAFARALAARHYDLVLVARNRERLETTAADLRARHGIDAEIVTADLTLPAELARVEARLTAAPPIDLLVNNAGFGLGHRFVRASVEDEERMLRIHVLAPTRLARAALPGMIERGRGAIINVSSLAAFAPSPRNATYAASKAFLNSFSESLALELAHTGGRVQALCPGFTHTEFHARAGMGTAGIPGWWWMGADEVAEASLKALAAGKVVAVPGPLNRIFARAVSASPRALLRLAARRVMNA